MFFIWDDRNEEHIANHRVEPHEAEYAVRRAKRPFPRKISDVKWLVRGRTLAGRRIHVIYVLRRPEELDLNLLTQSERAALEAGEAAAYGDTRARTETG